MTALPALPGIKSLGDLLNFIGVCAIVLEGDAHGEPFAADQKSVKKSCSYRGRIVALHSFVCFSDLLEDFSK